VATELNDIEVRVLGSLVEKQVTTPEYYPLTLNALVLACNQKNNRNPITSLDEAAVAHALETLREKNLTYVFYGSTSRVAKYKHVMTEVLHLTPSQLALMCVLMLRGPQTVGELRGAASRLHEFSSLEEVEETVNSLISREPDAVVTRLPRQPGQKEARFAHLLSGSIPIDETAHARSENQSAPRASQSDRVSNLESEVARLTSEMESLREQFNLFRRQFE
jgi:uncharacterized protein YceH (UPF0502 family)